MTLTNNLFQRRNNDKQMCLGQGVGNLVGCCFVDMGAVQGRSWKGWLHRAGCRNCIRKYHIFWVSLKNFRKSKIWYFGKYCFVLSWAIHLNFGKNCFFLRKIQHRMLNLSYAWVSYDIRDKTKFFSKNSLCCFRWVTVNQAKKDAEFTWDNSRGHLFSTMVPKEQFLLVWMLGWWPMESTTP